MDFILWVRLGEFMCSERSEGYFFGLREPVRLLAWEGSFIRCFTGSEAEYTLESELYALVACGENRITDMNSVQRASACQGVFYIHKIFTPTRTSAYRHLADTTEREKAYAFVTSQRGRR